jgi:hypothetical protein
MARLCAAAAAFEPWRLELQRIQMITEVGAGQNTVTIIMMPGEFAECVSNVEKWEILICGGRWHYF